ncbi:MAG: hypothetical protein AAF843_00955 [Bacteroidota bacterium]
MEGSIHIGKTINYSFEVTEDDLATFKGNNVHQVCSTFALAREIEWCTRQLILQIKASDQEGVGTKLSINHRSPAFRGNTVLIAAVVKTVEQNELICSFQATVEKRLVADGFTGQKLLLKSRIKEIFSTFER